MSDADENLTDALRRCERIFELYGWHDHEQIAPELYVLEQHDDDHGWIPSIAVRHEQDQVWIKGLSPAECLHMFADAVECHRLPMVHSLTNAQRFRGLALATESWVKMPGGTRKEARFIYGIAASGERVNVYRFRGEDERVPAQIAPTAMGSVPEALARLVAAIDVTLDEERGA